MNRSLALETSLVEWKLLAPVDGGQVQPALETSLVEWKQFSNAYERFHGSALETSLVEWKLPTPTLYFRPLCRLGNFLSGMETRRRDASSSMGGQPWKLP